MYLGSEDTCLLSKGLSRKSVLLSVKRKKFYNFISSISTNIQVFCNPCAISYPRPNQQGLKIPAVMYKG